MKVHKGVPELKITKFDAELVIEKVQDCIVEVWYDVEKQKQEVFRKLTEFKDALDKLKLTTTQQKE
jgi:hypothetical protein